jgi:hypothetical protein
MLASILLSALAVAGFVAWQRRTANTVMPAPQQTLLHQSIGRPVVMPVTNKPKFLRLVADPTCTATRAFAGRVVAASRAVPLQTVGCRPGECSCRYVPANDRRRGLRRHALDRRDNLRFGRNCNRRFALDRRSGGLWETRTHH